MGDRSTMKRKNNPTGDSKKSRKPPSDSVYVPEEDKHSRLQTFSSDIDQQDSLFDLMSEVAALREDVKTIKARLKRLERK